jgi:peptidoglycan/xylan/chitin deacetylase (PgdA/CDA1 family)
MWSALRATFLVTIMDFMKTTVFRIGKAAGLFHLSRFLMRRRLLILCFHGFQLKDEARFRPTLFMRASVLRQRLDSIQRYGFQVLPLEPALAKLAAGTLPNNAVCITLDDGFFSVIEKALPFLKTYDMPSTLYLTSYYVDKATPIFRLVVQYMFWKTSLKVLDLRDQTWGPIEPVLLTDRRTRDRLTWEIVEHGESSACNEEERQSICCLLGQRLDVDYDEIVRSRMLSLMRPTELSDLASVGMDVQMHTHRHRLSLDREADARREIRDNREKLRKILGQNKRHLCYPNGEWSTNQWPWLRKEAITSAVTCEPGMNTTSTPRLALYRVLDEDDLPQIAFEAELFGFCELMRIITGRRRRADTVRNV